MAGKIIIRELKEIADFEKLLDIQKIVWKHDDIDVTPVHQFCISSRMGAILLGAYVDGVLVGFVYSFPAIREGKLCQHSHLLAVLPNYQGMGIGKKLKLAQNREALKQGMDLITWTFDPMLAKNANLNFHALHVRCRTYFENYYGFIPSLSLGPGIPTDRLLVEWRLAKKGGQERGTKAETGKGPLPVAALERGKEARNRFPLPARSRLDLEEKLILAEIPSDIKSLGARPGIISAWQTALRRVMQEYFKRDYSVVDFLFGERCFYVLKKGEKGAEPAALKPLRGTQGAEKTGVHLARGFESAARREKVTIDRIEMTLLKLPYVHFFETSFGRESDRTFIILRLWEKGVCGWGECVAERAPLYSGETTEGAWHVLKEFLIPLVFRGALIEPEDFQRAVRRFRGNSMAKAGLELAFWDLKAKKRGVSLAKLYGGVRDEIQAGVSCGIEDSISELTDRIATYLEQGYRRIKIKVKPGWDIEVCEAVRKRYADIPLQVDANGAYSLADKNLLKELDRFNLQLIEQPFPPYDLWDHSRLQKDLRTPLCLDESILSLDTARAAVEMESCRIINIKVGRVGGPLEAIKIHDYCRDHGIPVWCGGMLESGIGRAHNIHIASLPNFKLPNDLSASRRYYAEDIIEPVIELSGPGTIRIPDGPGIGVNPVEERIRRAALRQETFKP